MATTKKRTCKCGSGKELQKGKHRCDDCRDGKKKKTASAAPASPAPRPTAGRTGTMITLDLSKRPELAMRLHQLAAENYRTVELQVLYMLTQEHERAGSRAGA